ncbi:LuxR C-terminal-related transcriptional regulator [Pseudomonas aeruginosa]
MIGEILGYGPLGESELLDRLALRQQPTWLFLDDFCHRPAKELDACLDRLLSVRNPAVQWWLSCRRRPACNLSRLLLKGDLHHVDGAALAFTVEEISQLLLSNGYSATQDAARQLHQRTAGWCAGVCMALLAGNGASPAAASAHSDLLSTYLEYELFALMPDGLAEIWRDLAHLERFNEDLCDHLFGPGEGVAALRDLRALGAFIEPNPQRPGWWRVSPALSQPALPSNRARSLLLSACRWFMSAGDWQAAVNHAMQAGQTEVVVSLLQEHCSAAQLLRGRNIALLLSIKERLPPELQLATPELIALSVASQLIVGRLYEAQESFRQLQAFLPQPDSYRQRRLLARCQLFQGALELLLHSNPEACRRHVEEAIEHLTSSDWETKLYGESLMTQAAMLMGDLERAQVLNREALKLARVQNSSLFEIYLELDQARLLETSGELERAESSLAKAHRMLLDTEQQTILLGRLAIFRGALALRMGREEEARALYQNGVAEAQKYNDRYVLEAHLGLAMLDAGQGNFTCAQDHLREAERKMQQNHIPEELYRFALCISASSLYIQQGDTKAARKYLNELMRNLDASPAVPDAESMWQAQYLLGLAELYEGQAKQALLRMTNLLEQARTSDRRLHLVEALLGMAECHAFSGDQARATKYLEDGLALGKSLSLIQPLRALRQRQSGTLRWFDGDSALGQATASIEKSLTRRELEVLQLIAHGCSNRQIALRLNISLHTVKTHLRRIHSKLDVERRTHAVAQARSLGLIS